MTVFVFAWKEKNTPLLEVNTEIRVNSKIFMKMSSVNIKIAVMIIVSRVTNGLTTMWSFEVLLVKVLFLNWKDCKSSFLAKHHDEKIVR